MSLALWLGGHILAGTVLFLFSALVTGASGEIYLAILNLLIVRHGLPNPTTLRDKADENERMIAMTEFHPRVFSVSSRLAISILVIIWRDHCCLTGQP